MLTQIVPQKINKNLIEMKIFVYNFYPHHKMFQYFEQSKN